MVTLKKIIMLSFVMSSALKLVATSCSVSVTFQETSDCIDVASVAKNTTATNLPAVLASLRAYPHRRWNINTSVYSCLV